MDELGSNLLLAGFSNKGRTIVQGGGDHASLKSLAARVRHLEGVALHQEENTHEGRSATLRALGYMQ